MRPVQLLLLTLIPIFSCQLTNQPIDGRPDTLTLFGIPKDLWRCGTSPYIKRLIVSHINRTCPLAAADFNHCCAVHDDCYDNQRGRDHCDVQLCNCMEYHVANSDGAAKCGEVTPIACAQVKALGQDAYDASVLAQNPLGRRKEELRVPEAIPEISEQYSKLYGMCETQHATLASCALNVDLCYRTPSDKKPHEECLLNLLRCLDDTKQNRESDNECDMEIEYLLWKIVSKEEEAKEGSGDVNILLAQAVMQNNTIVQKIYLQIVRTTSSHSWIVGFFVLLCIFLSCCTLIMAISRSYENRRDFHDDVIRVNVSTSSVGTPSRKETSESEVVSSSKSSSSLKKKKTSDEKASDKKASKK